MYTLASPSLDSFARPALQLVCAVSAARTRGEDREAVCENEQVLALIRVLEVAHSEPDGCVDRCDSAHMRLERVLERLGVKAGDVHLSVGLRVEAPDFDLAEGEVEGPSNDLTRPLHLPCLVATHGA